MDLFWMCRCFAGVLQVPFLEVNYVNIAVYLFGFCIFMGNGDRIKYYYR